MSTKFKFGDIVADRGRTKLRVSRAVVLSSELINGKVFYNVLSLETTRGGTIGGWYRPSEEQLEATTRKENGWEPNE